VNKSEIRECVQHADSNVLRAVLYLLTGERELANMQTIERERRGGAFIEHTLGDDDVQRVQELATDFLATRESGQRS
jgi:hypothetical protein